jgi:hypothetical protein
MAKATLSQTALEDKCAAALRRVRGLKTLRWVSVRRQRSGQANWTLSRIYPPAKNRSVDWACFNAVKSGMQEKYELRLADEQLELPLRTQSTPAPSAQGEEPC